MNEGATGVLLLLVLFQVKHLLADFMLQSAYIIENRRKYGHPGGLLHVAIHIVATAVVLAAAGGTTPGLFAALLAAEAVVHYHLDWAKDNFVATRGLTPKDARFWHATGIDQALHQVTYIVMAWAWAAAQ